MISRNGFWFGADCAFNLDLPPLPADFWPIRASSLIGLEILYQRLMVDKCRELGSRAGEDVFMGLLSNSHSPQFVSAFSSHLHSTFLHLFSIFFTILCIKFEEHVCAVGPCYYLGRWRWQYIRLPMHSFGLLRTRSKYYIMINIRLILDCRKHGPIVLRQRTSTSLSH